MRQSLVAVSGIVAACLTGFKSSLVLSEPVPTPQLLPKELLGHGFGALANIADVENVEGEDGVGLEKLLGDEGVKGVINEPTSEPQALVSEGEHNEESSELASKVEDELPEEGSSNGEASNSSLKSSVKATVQKLKDLSSQAASKVSSSALGQKIAAAASKLNEKPWVHVPVQKATNAAKTIASATKRAARSAAARKEVQWVKNKVQKVSEKIKAVIVAIINRPEIVAIAATIAAGMKNVSGAVKAALHRLAQAAIALKVALRSTKDRTGAALKKLFSKRSSSVSDIREAGETEQTVEDAGEVETVLEAVNASASE